MGALNQTWVPQSRFRRSAGSLAGPSPTGNGQPCLSPLLGRVSSSSVLAFTSSSSISITSPELVGRCTSSRRETVPAGFRIPAGRLTPAYLGVRDECQLDGHSTRLPRVPGAASVWPDGQCGLAGPVKLASCQAGSSRVGITLPPVC